MTVFVVLKVVAVWTHLGNILYFCGGVADDVLLILQLDS